MLKKILLLIILLLAGFVGVAAMQPDDFRVERALVMAVPAEVVFLEVNDLQQWQAWSPWAKMDPNMKVTFEGPRTGVGAVHTWAGNSDVGEGRMTIVESVSPEIIRMSLEFYKPMAATNTAEFKFQPDGAVTLVTWSMAGKNNLIGKAFGLIVDCDKMVGEQFEKGLKSLKVLVEGKSPQN